MGFAYIKYCGSFGITTRKMSLCGSASVGRTMTCVLVSSLLIHFCHCLQSSCWFAGFMMSSAAPELLVQCRQASMQRVCLWSGVQSHLGIHHHFGDPFLDSQSHLWSMWTMPEVSLVCVSSVVLWIVALTTWKRRRWLLLMKLSLSSTFSLGSCLHAVLHVCKSKTVQISHEYVKSVLKWGWGKVLWFMLWKLTKLTVLVLISCEWVSWMQEKLPLNM